MIYVGIDPSLKRTGIAILGENNKKLFVTSVARELLPKKSYENVYHDIRGTVSEVMEIIRGKVPRLAPVEIITEVPPVTGSYSPALWGLSLLLTERLQTELSLKTLYRLNPTYLGHIHGTRKYSKTDSVKLAESLISLMEEHYHISIVLLRGGSRVRHDEAEAVIFLVSLLVQKGLLSKVSQSYPKLKDNLSVNLLEEVH